MKLRLKADNMWYCELNKLLKSRMLSKNQEIQF